MLCIDSREKSLIKLCKKSELSITTKNLDLGDIDD